MTRMRLFEDHRDHVFESFQDNLLLSFRRQANLELVVLGGRNRVADFVPGQRRSGQVGIGNPIYTVGPIARYFQRRVAQLDHGSFDVRISISDLGANVNVHSHAIVKRSSQ